MKIFLRILAGLAVLIVGLLVFILLTWNKEYDAPTPDITASADSAIIARGKYLAFGPAHCATCHVPMDKIVEVENGLEMPLSGGWELDIPPGVFRAPNITPDMETGIGKLTDGQIARALRYGVKHDNTVLMPFMEFQEMSDEDLQAIISFLRSQEPVKHEVKPSEPSFLGKALAAFGLIKPEGPKQTPPKSLTKEPTAEYGKYLSNNVGSCLGCHTERDMKTGEYIGQPYGGGMKFGPDAFSGGYAFISQNITADPETGKLAEWNEDAFVTRFQSGRLVQGSPMPWGSYSRMDIDDMKALYRYLITVPPVSRKIEQTTFAPGEKMPE